MALKQTQWNNNKKKTLRAAIQCIGYFYFNYLSFTGTQHDGITWIPIEPSPTSVIPKMKPKCCPDPSYSGILKVIFPLMEIGLLVPI